MYRKEVSIKIIIVVIVAAAILIVPSSVLQLSHAQMDQTTILDMHNQERALVKVPVPIPPLVWSNNLANGAQKWANHLATLGLRCDPDPIGCSGFPPHDPNIRNVLGENLWMGGTGFYPTAQQVQSWINEKSNYVPGTPIKNWQPGDPVTGHYTQMVWRNTYEIGCAASTGTPPSNVDFLVCRYNTPGNFLGQLPY
ncbi:MAG: CAP domain-containing protein [Nitrososphaeraceae archaeon]